MKTVLLCLAVAVLLLVPASAAAKGKGPVYVPPNQSAASQYTEGVPTAGGDTPSTGVSHSGAGGGSSGSGGGKSGGSIARSTLSKMSHSGSSGAAAAALAQTLSPRRPAARVIPTSVPSPAVSKPKATGTPLLGTLTGSDAGSGIGVMLPIILIGSLLVVTALGIARVRRPGATS